MNTPPRLFQRFFRWFCHPKLLKYIEGDLMELYEERKVKRGKRKADIRFAVDVLLLFRPGIIGPLEGYRNLNTYGMYKSYFKIGWRSMLKNKTYSFINITGFSFGITVVLLAVMYVLDERRFDNFHLNSPNLYRITTSSVEAKGDKRMTSGGTGQVQGPAFKESVPEILEYVRVMGGDIYEDVNANNKTLTLQALYVDGSFFDVFSFELLHGSAETALNDITGTVITEGIARKFFNRTDVVGELLEIDANPSAQRLGKPMIITGVVKDPPRNSSIQFDVLFNMKLMQFSFDDTAWLNAYLGTFVVLHPEADRSLVIQKFNKVYAVHAREQVLESRKNYNYDPLISYGLQPITAIHLNPLYVNGGNREAGVMNGSNPLFSHIFLAIALFILLMAGINFVNISLAGALERSKEVGVRKITGGTKLQIMSQFFVESAIVCGMSFAFAMLFTQASLPVFNQLTDKQISFSDAFDTNLFFYFGAILAGLVLITGLCPAYILSDFRPLSLSYNKQKLSGDNISGRLLIVVQFSIAVFLAISTMVYYHQMDYIRVKDLGYNQHQLIHAGIKGNREYQPIKELLKAELANVPGINVVSFSGLYNHMSEAKLGDKSIVTVYKSIDENYLGAMEISVLAGRNFSPAVSTDKKNAVIVNEAFVKMAGLVDPVGAQIRTSEYFGSEIKAIVGVVKDFHFGPLHERILPMIMLMNDAGDILVKIDKDKQKEAMVAFEAAYKKAMPTAAFQYDFVDELVAKEYRQEQRWQKIIGIATGLSILICSLGLFGIAHLSTRQRMKEIGIRKVLGASVAAIVSLLSKDFVRLVFLGVAVASPLAFWAMNKWLENFAYGIEVQWWMVVVAGFAAVVIALITVSFQAVKAARTNPVNSLRSE